MIFPIFPLGRPSFALALAATLGILAPASAQTDNLVLPHGLTEGERVWWETHRHDLPANPGRGIPTPPPGSNLRTSAEWEEIEALTLTWQDFPCILKQITAASVSECTVIIFSENVGQTENYLAGNTCGGPVPMDNVEIVEAPSNSIWIRDYGANTVYTEWNDGRVLVDWLYNRPRPDDDVIPDVLADHMGLALYTTLEEPNDLMNTGGNWMSDGYGTAFASELIVEENSGGTTWWTTYPSHTLGEIDGIVEAYHGVHTYVKMNTLPYDGIHHIDMHMKLLDESTLLVSEYPAGVADGPQIEANLQYVLSNFTTKWGTPFEVIRIPSPPEQGGGYPNQNGDYLTYSNAVFVNNTVLLPTYYEQYDTTALRIWEEALPGYNIVGIDCDTPGEDIIALSGAIHCITHSVGVEDPLMISHLPLDDTENTTAPYPVVADISHRSGISGASLFWATAPDGPWSEVPMTPLANDTYTADIPAQTEGTHVHYYVTALAESGKLGSRPMPAPEGWWDFHVLGTVDGLDRLLQATPFQAVYPNPANAITCIELALPTPTSCEVHLRNALGQRVETLHRGELGRGVQRVFLDASTHAPGAYVVVFTSSSGRMWSQRLLIQ